MSHRDLDLEALHRGLYERDLLESGIDPDAVARFGYNALNRFGDVYSPTLDERHLASGGERPTWPRDKEFAVCLTHDVDLVTKHRTARLVGWGTIRALSALGDGQPRRAVRLFGRSAIEAIGNFPSRGPDPYHQFERWLEVEADIDAPSTFFFLPDRLAKPHETDHRYRYDDVLYFDGERTTVAGLMRSLEACGCEIGLHGSRYTHADADALRDEKKQVEDVLGHSIRSVRQHYLYYDVRKTPRVHEDAGFANDSSLGLKGNVGFRFGTCYPWHVEDLESSRRTTVLEVPLLVADGALLKPTSLGLSVDVALEYVRRIAEAVQAVGGVLTLLWHPSNVHRTRWLDLYVRTLDILDSMGAWFATVDEVATWWREYNAGLGGTPGVEGVGCEDDS